MISILDIYDSHWLDYITNHDQATIFHHPVWLNNLAECYGYRPFILAEKNSHGSIEAAIPMMEINHFGQKKRWISLPFSDYCYPLFSNADWLEKLTDNLILQSKLNHNPEIQVRWHLPYRTEIRQSSNFVLHTADLTQNSEEVFNLIHKKVRKYIRSSINRGVKVEWGTTSSFVKQFYHLQIHTRKKHRLPPQPEKYFQLLGKNILEKGLGSVLLAYHGKELLAGLVILHWQKTLTLKYGASFSEKISELRPNHILEWTAIQWGCEQGYKKIDAGRSDITQTGLRDYKTRWGYAEQPLFYSDLGGNPNKKPHHKNFLIKMAQPVIKASPLWLCRKIGEIIYKYFP